MSTVGEVIGRHHDEILDLWSEGAGRSASAAGLSPPELMSTMPDYLGSLGRSAEGEVVGFTGAQETLVERHLSNRLRQGFMLDEIVTEFAILGRSMSRILFAEPVYDR